MCLRKGPISERDMRPAGGGEQHGRDEGLSKDCLWKGASTCFIDWWRWLERPRVFQSVLVNFFLLSYVHYTCRMFPIDWALTDPNYISEVNGVRNLLVFQKCLSSLKVSNPIFWELTLFTSLTQKYTKSCRQLMLSIYHDEKDLKPDPFYSSCFFFFCI